jgi:hypothetical protein
MEGLYIFDAGKMKHIYNRRSAFYATPLFSRTLTLLLSSYNFAPTFTNSPARFNATTVSATISSTISFARCPALFTDPATTPIGLFDVSTVHHQSSNTHLNAAASSISSVNVPSLCNRSISYTNGTTPFPVSSLISACRFCSQSAMYGLRRARRGRPDQIVDLIHES